MKQVWTKKDGTVKPYKSKNINNEDYMCNIYNSKREFSVNDIGSIEVQKDICGYRLVEIRNKFRGYTVLCEGSQVDINKYLKNLLKKFE